MGGSSRKKRAARNPETRENYLIGLAIDLVEQKLLDGTASSQILNTLLNLATTEAKLKLEKLRQENRLTEAKVQAVQSNEDIRGLYEDALNAFKGYRGNTFDEEGYDEYEEYD